MNNDITAFLGAHWLDILSTVVGLIYIALEYKASIALWFAGIVMPAIDIYLFWSVGLYADFGMAIYYTLAAVYGYAVWRFGGGKQRNRNDELPITRMRKSQIIPSTAVFIVAWAAIYFILTRFTNSDVPVTDSFINALSFIGLWALARKYVEQWLIWIVVDVISCALYAYKGIPFKGALYGLYVIIAVMGYYKWRRMMKQ
ncbi:nicotinamide riboside transporter PnuC [Xylanibacter caecicola]|uniref:nicotinamide riboside transporter PnuC n=1 Tax=Xylanibacter caecicola TaxID=2736294 RepID=UPI002587D216|nr:nicotinamide riboside transporter PnuC [Xylanibacter caecicola]